MSTMLTDCLSCKKSFKSLYSLTKHRRDRHEDNSPVILMFKDNSGNTVLLPQPRQELNPIDQAGYKLWVPGLVERINATLHPRLPGMVVYGIWYTLFKSRNTLAPTTLSWFPWRACFYKYKRD